LFDRSRQGFAWVRGLGCCQSNKFSTGEGEGSIDEARTKAFEAIVERAGVVPVLS